MATKKDEPEDKQDGGEAAGRQARPGRRGEQALRRSGQHVARADGSWR